MRTAGLAALLILPAAPGAVLAQDAAPAAESAPAATRAGAPRVTIRTARRPDHSRIALDFPGAIPAYELTRTATGYDVRFQGRQPFDLRQFRPMTDVAGLSVVRDGADSILRLALPCPCEVEAVAEQRTLRFLVRRGAGAEPAAQAAAAPTPTPAPAPSAPPAPSAAQVQPAGPAGGGSQVITPRTARRPDHIRLAFDFNHALPPHDMRNSSNQYEIRLRGDYRFDMGKFRALTEVSGLTVATEGADSVIRFVLDCNCVVARETSARTLHLLFKRAGRQAHARATSPTQGPAQAPTEVAAASQVTVQTAAETLRAASQAAASATSEAPATPPAPARPNAPPRRGRQAQAEPPAPTTAEVERLRESITRQLGILNGTTPAPGNPAAATAGQPSAPAAPNAGQASGQSPGQPPGQSSAQATSAAGTAPTPQQGGGTQAPSTPTLRPDLPGPAMAGAAPVPPMPRDAANAPRSAAHRPSCAPDFDPGQWGGTTPGVGHAERLTALRTALAASGEGPADAAALAEYLVGQGLLPEALDLLRDRINGDLDEATRIRLQRVRDVARLLRRSPIDPASPLLAARAECEREDLALWQALAASARGDSAAVIALLPKVQRGLRAAPDRLRMGYAFALADGIGDNAEALRSLAAPIRNAVPATETDEANRNLLLARIAGLSGARDEERIFLRRAAAATRTIPGLFAAARLAAREAERSGPNREDARRAEERLIEIARTYRHDMLGEEASVLYAQLLLARDNLPGALLAADAASTASTRPFLESRGAALAARILRLLFVDAEGRTLPPAEERLAMFWGFEGYATPGERGDDIRMGAARLMLERDLPDAALDVVRELAAATTQTPQGALLMARVEAAAPEGDPQKALAILRAQDLGEDGRRAAALALARLNRPSDAANELGSLRARPDLGNRGRYLFLAQRWTDAANVYAELLRDPALDAAQRTEATGRYATAAALSPRPVTRVPTELLSPADSGTRSLLLLQAHEPAQRSGQQGARIELILNAIDRAKRIEAMATTTEAR